MIYRCFKFFDEYFKIEKINDKGGEAFFYLYSDPDEMNYPFANTYHRPISRDCILKAEYDDLGDTTICHFFLGDFKNGEFIPLIEFEENYNKAIFRYDDEKGEISKIF